MSAWSRFRDSFRPIPEPQAAQSPLGGAGARAVATGGKITQESEADAFGRLSTLLPPGAPEDAWRLEALDSDTLERTSPTRLMELLADLSPDVSRALWDWLRLCNPGWEVKAYRLGSDTEDPRAQAAIDTFLAQLRGYYGAVDVVIGRQFVAAFLRGAFLSELVLDQRGRIAVDLATPDPATVRFRRRIDAVRGSVWELCQWQQGQLVSLERPTIRYIPVDPFPGSAYGRPLASPALFSTLFLLAMLHDLRRVVQQQGYPRLDVEINMEQLAAAMPAGLTSNPEALQAWVDAAVAQVQETFAGLAPDETYVHTSVIKVNRPVGTVDAGSLGAIDGLITALERMAVRGLKTMPIFMALDQSASEGMANRMWEIHAAGIKAFQHLNESLWEHMLTTLLQAQGLQARVEFRFAELRAAELLRDEQVRTLRIKNARMLYDNGVISQDEQAQLAADKDKADNDVPRAKMQETGGQVGGQPDPGSTR